jgi:glycosyltransferase involved in cell wall biosynthesis
MPQRRVVLLTNAITPDRTGGLERYVAELAGGLARAGARVAVHARQVDKAHPLRAVDADGVEIHRFATPSKGHPLYALGYPPTAARAAHRAAAGAQGAAILHAHFPLQGLPLALADRPFVHTFHAPVFRELLPERRDAYLLPRPLQRGAVAAVRRTERALVRRATRLLTLSAFMAAEARALGAPAGRMVLLPGGVDTEAFRPGAPVGDPWASGPGPLLFAARRFVPRTGVVELVEACAAIAAQRPDARVAIAGGGPLEADVRARIRGLGLQDRVRLLGWVSDAELVGWYRAADLAVLPTQELEGFGLATAEAMACGTPVVGTPAGATPEVLRRLDAALVTRDPSPGAIADAVLALLADPGRLAGLAARARAAVHPELGWGTVVDRHLELYERHEHELLRATGGRR